MVKQVYMVGLVLALAGVAGAAPAQAQPPPTTSTSEPPAGSTASTTATSAPPPSTAAPRPRKDASGGRERTATTERDANGWRETDARDEPPAEAPPEEAVVVPQSPVPPAITPEAAITTERVTAELSAASRALSDAIHASIEATARAVQLEAEVTAFAGRLEQLRQAKERAARDLAESRALLKRRVVSVYTSGTTNRVNSILSVREFNDLVRRARFVDAVTDQDRRTLEEYRRALAGASADLRTATEQLETKRLLAADARRQADEALAALHSRQLQVDSLRTGELIATQGFVFPVDEPYAFSDTFGAPRMPGTRFAHSHQGTDVFAPSGTPLRAVERGVVTRVGTDTLGGTKLWLGGASGIRYYYAHLSGYAPGIAAGVVVEAGDVVGYVGNSGNARTTPPHLHFEIHPPGSGAVNPYPLLRSASDATRAARAAAVRAATTE